MKLYPLLLHDFFQGGCKTIRSTEAYVEWLILPISGNVPDLVSCNMHCRSSVSFINHTQPIHSRGKMMNCGLWKPDINLTNSMDMQDMF